MGDALKKDASFIEMVEKAITENLDDPDFRVEALAIYLKINRTLLYRKVKSNTGKTPSLFMREFRLKQCLSFLLNQENTIKEVAFSVGFKDAAHFTNYFKAFYGISPSEWKENNAKK